MKVKEENLYFDYGCNTKFQLKFTVLKTEMYWKFTLKVKNRTEPVTMIFHNEKIEDAITEFRRMAKEGEKLEFDYGIADFKDAELIKCEYLKINYSKFT